MNEDHEMNEDYERGGKDMLAMIREAYYKTDISTFEKLLDIEDEYSIRDFLADEYIHQGVMFERTRIFEELRKLADRYGIDI